MGPSRPCNLGGFGAILKLWWREQGRPGSGVDKLAAEAGEGEDGGLGVAGADNRHRRAGIGLAPPGSVALERIHLVDREINSGGGKLLLHTVRTGERTPVAVM